MPRKSPLRSAVIIRWPLSFEVTLEIDPDRVADGATVGLVALRLVRMGGSFVNWKPNFNQRAAIAQFEFETPHERDQFIAEALEVPGVSLAPPP